MNRQTVTQTGRVEGRFTTLLSVLSSRETELHVDLHGLCTIPRYICLSLNLFVQGYAYGLGNNINATNTGLTVY